MHVTGLHRPLRKDDTPLDGGSSNARGKGNCGSSFTSGPPCFEMVAEPSDPKGQGPSVRAPGFQVMWTFMAFVLMAADGGGNGGLGVLGMAESFVNMPEEPKAEEHHVRSCGKFDAYGVGDVGRQGEGQQGVQQMDVATWKSTTSPWTSLGSKGDMAWACVSRSWSEMVHQTGKWYSLDSGEAWNLVNETEPNDKHGNLNHFLEVNEYDMVEYGKQHLVINEFKVFDRAWLLENIGYKLGFAHCLDFIHQDLRASLHEQLRGQCLQWLAGLGEVCLQGHYLHPTFLPLRGG